MNFDEILLSIGEFGPYQRLVFVLLCLPNISTGLQKFVWIFLIMEPKHRCKLLIDRFVNGSSLPFGLPEDVLNKTTPYDPNTHYFSECLRYKTHLTTTHLYSNWTAYNAEVDFTRQAESCSSYVYDTSEFMTTISSEFDLVCSHAWEQANGQAIYVVGELISALVSGYISDRYGRRRVILSGIIGHTTFAFLSACAPNHVILLVFRLIMGFSAACMYLSCFVIIMEFIGPSHRMVASNAPIYFFSTGYILVLPFAYLIRQWRYLQLAVTIPALGLLCHFWLLPESPRWLMANNKFEECKAILERVAASNKTTVPKDLKADDIEEDNPSANGETYSHLTLLKYPKLRIRILVCCYLWFVSSGVYYGLTLNTSNMGGNLYINFLISAILEFPSVLFTPYLVRWIGRVRGLSLSMFVGGLALAVICAVPQDNVTVIVTLAMIGKFGISVAFKSNYIYTGEAFPTVVRNTALGMCSSLARIGAISAPYIALLSQYWQPLPFVVFGGEAIIASVLTFLLPETKDKTLPETILDGETFGMKTTSCTKLVPDIMTTSN